MHNIHINHMNSFLLIYLILNTSLETMNNHGFVGNFHTIATIEWGCLRLGGLDYTVFPSFTLW